MEGTDAAGGIGVVLGTDHVIFRECLRDWIGRLHGISVVGEARSPAEVPQVAARVRPDVVLAGAGGGPQEAEWRALRQVRRHLADVKIVVLALSHTVDLGELAGHGAHWCLPATSTRADLVLVLRNLTRLEPGPSPRRPGCERRREADAEAGPRWTARLSVRERQVLDLVSQALSNAQIGARLSITEGTVKRHLRNIYGKLGAVSRIDAVNKAAGLPTARAASPGQAHCLGAR
ncbi:response regulator transcription factor [Nonomuraea ceibae]|uniref:response regulator transcription factor n=1 Tax=Nonomuraea ceibae TaxID=1935170 RepID=UPI001C5DA2DB|nr:response regulator transcription factor [Nonomuraea ceibae]